MEANSRRALLAGLPALAVVAACRGKEVVSAAEVLAISVGGSPVGDPTDRAWDDLPVHRAALVPQDMVEPRLLTPTTPELRVKAMADGTSIAFRLEWDDAGASDMPGPARFTDACAVQVPLATGPDLPAPQMGEAGRGVEMTYWRAAWQATCDGRGDSIRDLHPRASIDHYPFESAALPADGALRHEMALRYAPARAVGNTMAGPRSVPVEDLVAEGPGTVTRAPAQTSSGRGRRTPSGWSVVLVRRMPPGLTPVARTQVAFAVWQGLKQEAGPKKMRTGWVPLALQVRA